MRPTRGVLSQSDKGGLRCAQRGNLPESGGVQAAIERPLGARVQRDGFAGQGQRVAPISRTLPSYAVNMIEKSSSPSAVRICNPLGRMGSSVGAMAENFEKLEAQQALDHVRVAGPDDDLAVGIAGVDVPVECRRIHELPLVPAPERRPKWDFVRRWNERELVNTANIDWYVHARYPDRKIIIWAHNAHVVEGFLTSNFSKFSAIAPTELPIRPSGLQIRTALGDELFSIMFTAYEGSVRRMDDALALTSKTVPLEPAPEGSLEERLHTAGFRYAILPLGAARPPFSDWLNTPRVGRIDTEFLPPQVLDWRRVADAMFFIDIVEPSMIAVP